MRRYAATDRQLPTWAPYLAVAVLMGILTLGTVLLAWFTA